MNIWNIKKGDMVKGRYFGATFTGRVLSTRGHTCDHTRLVIDIELHTAITIFGDERGRINVEPEGDTGRHPKGHYVIEIIKGELGRRQDP